MVKTQLHWTERIQKFDRRWIFLIMGISIVAPLLYPLNLPIEASEMVKASFYTVENLKEGDTVFLSLDLDPASTPELEPYYRALMLHLKRKKIKIVIATTWYAAPPLIERWISETIESSIIKDGDKDYQGKPDSVYAKNEDYVWLGFREGKEATINKMANDIRATFDGRAADGTDLNEIAMMQGINSLRDFSLLIAVSAGFPGIKEYVQQAQGRGSGIPMIGACTAVSVPEYTPYYSSGQLLGLVGGMAKAAEYEQLVGKLGTGMKGTDVLNFGHLAVILAIVFGNFIYFAGRFHRKD